jgi:2-iminobutanoate/2-iminopropanoate deaminase
MGVERLPARYGPSISEAVVVEPAPGGRFVYISGQVAHDPEAEGKDLGTQAAGCFDQMERILARCGGSLADVVRVTAWLTSLDDYAEYDRVRRERFGDSLPASASMQVAGLLGRDTKIEIDAVAYIGG